MITEDYVSYEVAKLFKEKGFDWMCNGYYNKDDDDSEPYFGDGEGADNWNNQAPSVRDLWFSAPTHQMVMKWLREVHKIIIAIRPPYNWNGKKPTNYLFDVWHYCDDNTDINISVVSSTIYEEAVEAALKYCLTKLI